VGHFAANTELYCCERDFGINTPEKPYMDIFYLGPDVSNCQLAKMWGRELFIVPRYIGVILAKTTQLIHLISWLLPIFNSHLIGSNSNHDRDIHNLLYKSPQHLHLSLQEEEKGKKWLIDNNIPLDSKIVLLQVRDGSFLDKQHSQVSWQYHNYRDCNIDNFILAAEELAERGFYVIRLGVNVERPLKSSHERVIDYAMNGMREDFIDIYLSSVCEFIVSSGSGIDAVAICCYRKPSVFVNRVPVGHVSEYFHNSLFLVKHHILIPESRELRLDEIFLRGLGYCLLSSCFTDQVELVENTPEEILDIVVEMVERLDGTWEQEPIDEYLQGKFWSIFPLDATTGGKRLHGEVKAQHGSTFLRANYSWLISRQP